jgi:hypothetical protein
MRDVINVVPPSFAAGNACSLNILTVCTVHAYKLLSANQFRSARQDKRMHRFAATTGSLKQFLSAVFVITFSI